MVHNARPIKILVADDHFVVREGLRSMILRENGMIVAAEASNGGEAIDCFERVEPDITIMDLRMPVMNGIEATKVILSIRAKARVLVLSNLQGDEDIYAALQAGAAGYLFKHSSGSQLIPAIRAVLAGKSWIPPEVSARLSERGVECISEREREIIRHIVLGEPNRNIGARLGITEETVKSHLKRIFSKLKVRDRTEAVMVALKRGIVHFSDH